MNREALMVKNNMEIPALPISAIRGHLCFRCLLPAENLSKCGGCKRAVYCSKTCQNLDWRVQHKKDCKVLKSINALEEKETVPSRSRDLWTDFLVRSRSTSRWVDFRGSGRLSESIFTNIHVICSWYPNFILSVVFRRLSVDNYHPFHIASTKWLG